MARTRGASDPSAPAEGAVQDPTSSTTDDNNGALDTNESKMAEGDESKQAADGSEKELGKDQVDKAGKTEENPGAAKGEAVDKQQQEDVVKAEEGAAASDETNNKEPAQDKPPIWEPAEFDVLSGRGASVNAHGGNKKFRAYCFARKPEFQAGNHAAKRRIATEIVAATTAANGRFLKRKEDKGPWFEMTNDQAILKACQVMRDYKRPDRVAIREMMAQNGSGRKRQRTIESTPMIDLPMPTVPVAPIIENPFGVHDHDVLSGRGAFVNGHVGNARLRDLALARKIQFDAGNYTEKRSLATEIVQHIRSLDPPGRFLKRVQSAKQSKGEDENWLFVRGLDGAWEELNDEKAIHKACQVMRDIDRPDRKDRELKRKTRKQKSFGAAKVGSKADEAGGKDKIKEESAAVKDSMTMLAETSTTAEKAAVEEAVASAVAATEAALDKALDSVAEKANDMGTIQV